MEAEPIKLTPEEFAIVWKLTVERAATGHIKGAFSNETLSLSTAFKDAINEVLSLRAALTAGVEGSFYAAGVDVVYVAKGTVGGALEVVKRSSN